MAVSPRFYLTEYTYNYMTITLRQISMIPGNPNCYDDVNNVRGRTACMLRKWLNKRYLEPFNCTPFYLHYKEPRLQVCKMGLIAQNYDLLTSNNFTGVKVRLSFCN